MRQHKNYEAKRDRGMPVVIVTYIDEAGEHIRQLKHVVRHSATTMEWGYCGSGPADLAFSLLLDHFGGGGIALIKTEPVYRDFERQVVSTFAFSGWKTDTANINEMLQDIARRAPTSIVDFAGAHT